MLWRFLLNSKFRFSAKLLHSLAEIYGADLHPATYLVTAIIHCVYQIQGARLVCMDLTRPSPLACSGWGLAHKTMSSRVVYLYGQSNRSSGPSSVGKTTARRRLTEEITNISPDEIVPSTGIEAPLTVELYHPTEQSSVLLSTGWRCQKLEEQCRSLCGHVLNSPASSTVPQLDPSSLSNVTVSPAAASTATVRIDQSL